MATPHLPRLRTGQAPTAEQWNALVALVEAMGTEATGTAFAEIGIASSRGGKQVLDGRLKKHWAKILSRGVGNLYAHRAAAPNGDGTFTDLPLTSEYPHGTADADDVPAREANGRTSFDDELPFYTEIWEDETGRGYLFDAAGVGGACAPCAFLVDRDALIQCNKAFRVKFKDGSGRCACFPDQGLDDDDPWIAVYNAGLDAWELIRTGVTCCGCFRLVLDVPGDGTMTGTLSVARSCPDLEAEPETFMPYTRDLIFLECCQELDEDGVLHTFAVLTGEGELNCGELDCEDAPCDHTFKVEVECVDCDLCSNEICPEEGLDGPACELCLEACGPVAWYISATNFTAGPPDNRIYNGNWYLMAESGTPCLWSASCGGATVTLTLTDDGSGNAEVTLTFTGGGGTVTYELSIPVVGLLECFETQDLDLLSGESAPLGLQAVPKFCEECPDFCEYMVENHPTLSVAITNKTGDCTCLPDTVTITWDDVDRWYNDYDEGCPCAFNLLCEDGLFQITEASCAASPTLVSYTRFPFQLVFDVDNALGSQCTGTYRATITAPP